MTVRKLIIDDDAFERTSGHDGDVWQGNVVDQRQGGTMTFGYGRYGPNETLVEEIAVYHVMIVLEGRNYVSNDAGTETAGLGEIIYMPKGFDPQDQIT